jgi:cell division initiation protein
MSIKFSAEDIANQTFESRFRGYDRRQVEEFLTVLSREYDHIVTELKQARHELKDHKSELREYRRREKSLHDALNMAKQVGEEIKQQAERDAELTMADAELRSEKMLSGVQNRVTALREELFGLQQQRVRCETEMRNVLESHIKMLDLLSSPEGETRSSISRAPQPPQGNQSPQASQPSQAKKSPESSNSQQTSPDIDEVLSVSDADIESAEDVDDASATSPGMMS